MRYGMFLLVEDDREVAQVLMAVMQARDYHATHASSSQQAIELAMLHQNELSLVVCDVRLPGDSGPAVVAKLRKICPRIKTLFTSGFPVEHLLESGILTLEMLQARDTAYIQKPFLPKDFAGAIQNLLDGVAHTTKAQFNPGITYARAAY